MLAECQQQPVRRLARLCERRTIDPADSISAVSAFAARAPLGHRRAAARVARVPESVDADRFHPAAPADVDPSRILAVGKMNWLKGLFVLGEAMRQLFARDAAAR